jgi:DNA-binding MarR family transcriptional regulator
MSQDKRTHYPNNAHFTERRTLMTEETFDSQDNAPGETHGTISSRESAARQLSQLVEMGRYLHRLHRRGTAPWGDPRHGQGRVLAILKLKPEISQRELSYLLDMSKQGLAELLAKLENRGLITREPSPTDRRVMMVRLTADGRDASNELGRRDAVAVSVLADFTDDEAAQLSIYLDRIIGHLSEQIEELEPEDRRMRREELRHMPEELRDFGEDFTRFGPGPRPGHGPGRGHCHGDGEPCEGPHTHGGPGMRGRGRGCGRGPRW